MTVPEAAPPFSVIDVFFETEKLISSVLELEFGEPVEGMEVSPLEMLSIPNVLPLVIDQDAEVSGVTATAVEKDKHLETWDWVDTTPSPDLRSPRLPAPIEPMPVEKLRLVEAIKLVFQEGLLLLAASVGPTPGSQWTQKGKVSMQNPNHKKVRQTSLPLSASPSWSSLASKQESSSVGSGYLHSLVLH